MRPLLVLSVPHSGTMFTLSLLPSRNGYVPHALANGFEKGRKYWAHLREPRAIEAAENCFTVIPVRSALAMRRSWERRKMDPKDLERQLSDIESVPGFRLPLDTPNRDEELRRLSGLLGVTLCTDWRPINSLGL